MIDMSARFFNISRTAISFLLEFFNRNISATVSFGPDGKFTITLQFRMELSLIKGRSQFHFVALSGRGWSLNCKLAMRPKFYIHTHVLVEIY